MLMSHSLGHRMNSYRKYPGNVYIPNLDIQALI